MRITRVLFRLSDACAWLLVFVALLFALVMASMGPMFYAMDHEPVSWPELISTLVGLLVVAKGAYELTRRQPWALMLVSVPGIAAFLGGGTVFGIAYLGLVLLVFGVPFLLAFLELRAQGRAR